MFELFQPAHLLFVALVALVVFGPKRMMEVGRSLGQGYQRLLELREELEGEMTPTVEVEPEEEPLSDQKKG